MRPSVIGAILLLGAIAFGLGMTLLSPALPFLVAGAALWLVMMVLALTLLVHRPVGIESAWGGPEA